MKTKTKINLSILVAGLVLLALIIVGYRSCNPYDKKSILKGKYDALSQEYETQKNNSKAQISSLRNIIAQKDEKIRNITAHIVEKEGEISTLHAQTDELEEAYAKVDKSAQDVNSLNQRVVNLETQVTIWKQKFTISEGIIADKNKIIFNLNEKYESQVTISFNWETLYNNEVKLHALCKQRLTLADKKLKGLRFGSTIKNGLVIGLAVGVIYGLVR